MAKVIFIGSGFPRPKLVASATSTAETITVPANSQEGDTLILIDFGQHNSTGLTKVIPTGFTEIATTENSPANSRRTVSSCRLAPASYGSTVLTGQNAGTENRKILLVFRGGRRPTSLTPVAVDGAEAAGNMAAQTITVSGGTAPLIAFASYAATPAVVGGTPDIDPRTFTISGSDAKDGEVSNVDVDAALWVAFKSFYFGGTLSDITADMEDEGTANHLQTNYIELSA